MKSKFKKFSTGIKTDLFGTLGKVIKYFAGILISLFDGIVYPIYRILLFFPSVRVRSKLKHALNPVARMDYAKSSIYLHADSELGVFRARACSKEPETVAWIEQNIKQGEVFYDVGANVGAYSLVAAKFLDNNVQVYAFEPSFSTYDQLCRNVVLNGCQDSIYPYMTALAEQTGSLTFHYRSIEGGSSEHFSSPNPSLSPVDMKPVYKQTIFAFSLDTLVDDYHFPVPHHIKIDVDGPELSVLKGAHKTLATGGVKSILVEVCALDNQDKQVVDYLTSLGFDLVSRHDRGGGVYWNDIFIKRINN